MSHEISQVFQTVQVLQMSKSQGFVLSHSDNKILKTCYSRYSSPSSRKDLAIVFAHGFFSNSSIFRPFIEKTAGLCTIILPDMIGRKPSDYSFSRKCYSFNKYVADYLSIISSCGFQKVIWMGTSMGALVGMKIASMHNSPIKAIAIDNPFQQEEDSVDLRYHKVNWDFTNVASIVERLKASTEKELSEVDCLQFVVDNFNFMDDKILPDYDKHLIASEKDESFMNKLEAKWVSIDCPKMLLRARNSKTFMENSFRQMSFSRKIDVHQYKGDDMLVKFTDEVVEAVVRWIEGLLPQI